MRKAIKFYVINVFLLIVIFSALYLLLATKAVDENSLISSKPLTSFSFTNNSNNYDDYNVWLIFTKTTNRSLLTIKFKNLVHNLMHISTIPLQFHIIIDQKSEQIARYHLNEIYHKLNKSIQYSFYDIEECASKISDIVDVMTPYFSSKPGTYYNDALFYISLGLYRIAPKIQKRAVLLDCDLYFKKDIRLLFDQFQSFKETAFYGIAPELTPVYRHILYMYKMKHNTTFGEYYNSNRNISNSSVIHPYGFQGYNSGVVLIDFKKQRQSKQFSYVISKENVKTMTEKYKFRGHLGDQDFYTLLGYEYPELIQTIHCGFNRQLCVWWRDHGYSDIFNFYFKCKHEIVVLHGNCNTRIPKE